MAVGLTQPVTEMSTRDVSWGAGVLSRNSVSLNLLESWRPVQTCIGIAGWKKGFCILIVVYVYLLLSTTYS